MFKIYDETAKEGACLRVYDEPESPNEGACLRYMFNNTNTSTSNGNNNNNNDNDNQNDNDNNNNNNSSTHVCDLCGMQSHVCPFSFPSFRTNHAGSRMRRPRPVCINKPSTILRK